MNVSIVIPVYRSAICLDELVSRIVSVMQPLALTFEVILVNDASPDTTTWSTIVALARRHQQVRGIDLLCNTGQFRTTLCGLEQAQGDIVVTMDDDLQHPPEEIPKLLTELERRKDLDCVMGAYSQKKHSLPRNIGSMLNGLLLRWIYKKPRNITITSFRAMRSETAKSLTLFRSAHPQIGPLILGLTNKIGNVRVCHHDRVQGKSGYTFVRLMGEMFQSMINGSIVPLRIVSIFGFCCAGLAFVIAFWFFIRKLSGGINVPGYTSIILAVVFFSGTILVSIGVLGEYIARIIRELTGMPRHVIRQTTDSISKTGS